MKKGRIFLLFIQILMLIILVRLYNLQIVKGNFYEELSKRNYLKFIILPAPRGLILDRNGKILASNKISYSIYLVPPYKLDDKNKYKKLAEILSLSYNDLEIKLKNVYSYTPAILLKNNLSIKEISSLEGNRDKLPPFIINMELKRVYPYGNLASHILGYMGEISKEELDENYSLGDFVGKTGIEKIYENYLKGKKGYRGIDISSGNKSYNLLSSKDPEPGNTIVLSIDLELQNLAEKAIGNDAGAIIVSNPFTGEILALVSNPSFDPNKFIEGFSIKEWNELVNNEKKPLNNRAISCLYPPGSIFKLITALSAVENGKVSLNEKFYCSGYYRLGSMTFSCWKKSGHGRLNFLEGIAQSCNIVFFNIGLRVGPDEISKMAKNFGLNDKLGIDLPNEIKGFIPSPQWKKENLKEPWYPGDTLNMSIGQGYILLTPLDVHFIVSMIATEGLGYRPHLLKEIINPKGEKILIYKPELIKKVSLKKETWNIIKEGMKLVVERGTGRIAQGKIWKVAGKTGTAENPHGEGHAWFSAFFPYENPKYVVTVFIEHGKTGGGKSAPIAKQIIDYLEKKEVEGFGKNFN